MELQPKIEPGSVTNDHLNLEDTSIQQLVSVLRTAYLTEDFDRVEGVLVSRYKRLQTEILRLQEMVELEKLTRFQAEEDLRNREELCERGKRAQDNYEKLLKQVKKNTHLADRDNIGELRKKKNELELEVCELKKLKEKWVDDSNALAQLRIRVGVLEKDKNAFEDEGNVGDYEIVEPTPLRRNEPPSKRLKNAQGASSSDMVHPDTIPKAIVYVDVKSVEVEDDVKPADVEVDIQPVVVEVDVCEQFTTKQEFVEREHMLRWIRMEAIKLGFNVVIRRSDNGSDRRKTFVSMRCERRGTCQQTIRKLKQDDIRSKKCDCPFKLHGFRKANNTWKFNVVSGIHNHYLCHKVTNHPVVCRLNSEEKKTISNMTLNEWKSSPRD